jgi:hypothetical protein
MAEKSKYNESFFLPFAFIVSATLGISLVLESTLHFLNINNQYLSWGLSLLALAGVYVFSKSVFLGLFKKSQYLILFSNLLLIGIGTLLLLEAVKQ